MRAPLCPCAGKVHLLRPRAESLPSVSRSVIGSTSAQRVRTAGRTWFREISRAPSGSGAVSWPAREFFCVRPVPSWRRRSQLANTLKKGSPWRQQAKTIAYATRPCCAGNPTLKTPHRRRRGAGALNGWLHVCAIEATTKIAITSSDSVTLALASPSPLRLVGHPGPPAPAPAGRQVALLSRRQGGVVSLPPWCCHQLAAPLCYSSQT